MRLVQFLTENGHRRAALVDQDEGTLRVLQGVDTIYQLIMEVAREGGRLTEAVAARLGDDAEPYDAVYAGNRMLPPIDHPDPAHCYITGTGLNHLGSAQARNAMHAGAGSEEEPITDSMQMFQWGLEGGKPGRGKVGVQPEWFYKGNGECVVPPGGTLAVPSFGLDGGDEAEAVGVYVVGPSGEVLRVGYAIGNEFSDHVMEQQNYLYLAHSKLRQCSFGPELLVGALPEHVEGTVRVTRKGSPIWSSAFTTGEGNMTHSLENLEHHHFKYAMFRRPGDLHCHFLGASVLSFSARVDLEPGDIFEIEAPQLSTKPLRNALVAGEEAEAPLRIRDL